MRTNFADAQATEKWIKELAKTLRRPCVVHLDGELGAGKTQVARWLTEGLGAEPATSPTFALHHSYTAPSGPIEHWDLYRLTSDSDLESTGFWDLLKEDGILMIVEWSSRLPIEVWPKNWSQVRLKIENIAGEARAIELSRF